MFPSLDALLVCLVVLVLLGVPIFGTNEPGYFATPAGLIYVAALIAFACMPLLINWDRPAHTPTQHTTNSGRG